MQVPHISQMVYKSFIDLWSFTFARISNGAVLTLEKYLDRYTETFSEDESLPSSWGAKKVFGSYFSWHLSTDVKSEILRPV